MSSRRKLKKSIKAATCDLFMDCVALQMCHQADVHSLNNIMEEIIHLHIDVVSRISHVERGCESKYFQKLKTYFQQKVEELSARIVAV